MILVEVPAIQPQYEFNTDLYIDNGDSTFMTPWVEVSDNSGPMIIGNTTSVGTTEPPNPTLSMVGKMMGEALAKGNDRLMETLLEAFSVDRNRKKG
jgi:hypothetical protein